MKQCKLSLTHYILNEDKTIEPIELFDDNGKIMEDNLLRWSEFFAIGNRRIGLDGNISTVFLGIDHSFLQDEPILFETAIEENGKWNVVERYETYEQALLGHKKWVETEKPR